MIKFITVLLLSICLVCVGGTIALARLQGHTASTLTASVEQPKQTLIIAQSQRTNCPEAKIQNVQIESSDVLYRQVGAPWRRLGPLNSEGTKARLTALLSAQASNKDVMVAYPVASYNCNQENFSQEAYIVRTY